MCVKLGDCSNLSVVLKLGRQVRDTFLNSRVHSHQFYRFIGYTLCKERGNISQLLKRKKCSLLKYHWMEINLSSWYLIILSSLKKKKNAKNDMFQNDSMGFSGIKTPKPGKPYNEKRLVLRHVAHWAAGVTGRPKAICGVVVLVSFIMTARSTVKLGSVHSRSHQTFQVPKMEVLTYISSM